jgi:hypothetical protein
VEIPYLTAAEQLKASDRLPLPTSKCLQERSFSCYCLRKEQLLQCDRFTGNVQGHWVGTYQIAHRVCLPKLGFTEFT